MMVARAQPRVVIFTQQEQLGALLVGQSHWQWGRSRHRQQPLKNKSDAIEYIIITTYTSMPYFCHIPLGLLVLAIVFSALVANRHTIEIPLRKLLDSIESTGEDGVITRSRGGVMTRSAG